MPYTLKKGTNTMPPKRDKSPLKRTYKEVTETPSEHEKPTSPVLDTAKQGTKKVKVEQNKLQPEAALQQAFTQVAGKVQKELREETEAVFSQKDVRNKHKDQSNFARLRMIDNTNKVKNLLDHNPNFLEQSRKNNHDRIKYYLELGAANPVSSGYKDKKGIMKYYQLKLEEVALYKGITGSDMGVKEANGTYATTSYKAGIKDWDNKATSHMKKWEEYGKILKSSELTDNRHFELFDHRVKSVSVNVGFCINEHLIQNMNEEQKHQNQERFNQVRENLLELTDVLKMNAVDIDTIIRETGHKYTQARGRTDVNIDIDKMISLASSHKSQKSESPHVDQPEVSSSSNIHSIHESSPENKKTQLPKNEEDFDI